jgi:hypothetical protein
MCRNRRGDRLQAYRFILVKIGLGDILIHRDIFNHDYRMEGRNLSDDISKISLWFKTIVILPSMCIYVYYKNTFISLKGQLYIDAGIKKQS